MTDQQQPQDNPHGFNVPNLDERIVERATGIYIDQQARGLLAGAEDEPLEVVTLAQLRRRPPMRWIADRFIASDTVAALSGPAGGGKSFIAVDLACSIATGEPFLGDRPTKPGRVLYIAGEGVVGLPRRIDAWEQRRGVPVPEYSLVFVEAGVNLSSDRAVQKLVELNALERFDLVIVDTFSTLSGVESENDAAMVANALRALVRVRRANPGSAGLIIHHTGKMAERGSRGSSAFQANVDTSWILTGSDVFELTTEAGAGGKMKDAPRDTIMGLRIEECGPSAVIVQGPATINLSADEERLEALEALGDTFTRQQAIETLGEPERTVERALQNLQNTGRIARVKRGVYQINRKEAK